jgi:peptidyl-prolyl cis-trans isomerase D
MLRGIRKASANWLGRTVMGVVMTLLAGSFAIWGINDIFRGYGSTTVAKIGGTDIPIQLFQQTYNDRLQALGQQLGKPITPEEANSLGLDRQVLGEMVAQAGLDLRAQQMRLGISDQEIARRITSDPSFKTPEGQFDRARFEDLLRNAGFTEQRYVAEQRNVMLRREIIDSLSGGIPVPTAWLDAINELQNEQRSVEYVSLDSAQAGDIPQPTDDQLSKYFNERKITFRAPEYRKIVTVTLTPVELAKTIEVSDDDVKKEFDAEQSKFITPERRQVEQIVFPTMAEAQAASDRIKNGLTFAALATERGLKQQDIDLGTLPKAGLFDPAVADAAFSLKEGEVSAPVQGRFGPVLVTVTKILPEEDKTLAEVAPLIRNQLAVQRAKSQVQDIHDKMEDDRAGGATVEEAAQKLKLPIVTYDALDRSGHDPSSNPVTNLAHADEVISAAFATDVGVDNDPIEADGGYIWYDVTAITPARDRNLDEVKSQVEEHWRDDEIASRLKAKAADLLDKLKNGTSFDSLATANGLKIETAADLTREKPSAAISANVLAAIFHTAKDTFASAQGDKPSQWVVFRVTDVKTPSLNANSDTAKRIEQTLQTQLSGDVLGQYMAWLENDLGTSINQAAVAQATGGNEPNTN